MVCLKKGKLYHIYNVYVLDIVIRMRETVSYLQYVYDINCMHQKGEAVSYLQWLCSRLCVSERGKLYHTYNMFMIYIVCIREAETVSYLQYVYVLDLVYQKEGNCIIPRV
jgi:hypothetical protein